MNTILFMNRVALKLTWARSMFAGEMPGTLVRCHTVAHRSWPQGRSRTAPLGQSICRRFISGRSIAYGLQAIEKQGLQLQCNCIAGAIAGMQCNCRDGDW